MQGRGGGGGGGVGRAKAATFWGRQDQGFLRRCGDKRGYTEHGVRPIVLLCKRELNLNPRRKAGNHHQRGSRNAAARVATMAMIARVFREQPGQKNTMTAAPLPHAEKKRARPTPL